MDKRWQRGLDGLGAEQPPCSQGPWCHCRMRRIAPNLDKTLLARTGALAEQTGGLGARQWRAALDSPPRFGAGRGEDPLPLLGHALRKAVGLAAQALDTSPAAVMEAARLTLVGHRRLKAALALAWGQSRARARALGLGLDAVARWPQWLAPHHTLAAQAPPLQEGMDPSTPISPQDTEPAPAGGPGGRRSTPHVAPDRRLASEEPDRRHGRQSSAKTCNGVKEHVGVALESKGIRAGVGRPAHEPEPAAVALLAEPWEQAPGLLQRDSDLG
jgi:hypothetical protein